MLSLSFDGWATHEVQVNPLSPLSLQDPRINRTQLTSLSRSLMCGKELTGNTLPSLFIPADLPFSIRGMRFVAVSTGIAAYLVCGSETNTLMLYDIQTGELELEMSPEVDGSLLGGIAYVVQKKNAARVVFMVAYSATTLCCYYYKDKALEQQKITASVLELKNIATVMCLPMTDASSESLDTSKGAGKTHQQFSILVADTFGSVVRLTISTKTEVFKTTVIHEAETDVSLLQLHTVAVPLTIETLDPYKSSGPDFSILIFIVLKDKVVIKACGTIPQTVLSMGVLVSQFLPEGLLLSAITGVETGSTGGFQTAYNLRILFASESELSVVSLMPFSSKYQIAPSEVSFKLDHKKNYNLLGLRSICFLASDLAVLFCSKAWYAVFLITPIDALGHEPAISHVQEVDSHGLSGDLNILDIDTPFFTTDPVYGPRLLCTPAAPTASWPAKILSTTTLDSLCAGHASSHSQHLALPLVYNYAYRVFGLGLLKSDIFANSLSVSFNPLELSACLYMHEGNHRSTAWTKHLAGSLQAAHLSEDGLAAVNKLLDLMVKLFEAPFQNDPHGYVVSVHLLALAASLNALSTFLRLVLKALGCSSIREAPPYFLAALVFLILNFQLGLLVDDLSALLDALKATSICSNAFHQFVCPLIQEPNFILRKAVDPGKVLENIQSLCLLNSCTRQQYDDLLAMATTQKLEAALFFLYVLRVFDGSKECGEGMLRSDSWPDFFKEVRRQQNADSREGLFAYHQFLRFVLTDLTDTATAIRTANIRLRTTSGLSLHLPVYLANQAVVIDTSRASSLSSGFYKTLHNKVFTGNPNELVLEWISIDCQGFCLIALSSVAAKAAGLIRKSSGSNSNYLMEFNHVLITLQNLVFDTSFIENLKSVDSVDNPQIFRRSVTTGRLNFESLLLLSHVLFDISMIILDTMRHTSPGTPVQNETLNKHGILPEIDKIAACKMLSRLPECCWIYLLLVRAMETPEQLEACLTTDMADNVFTKAFSCQSAREMYAGATLLVHFPMFFFLKYLFVRSRRFSSIYTFLYYVPWYFPLDLAKIYSCLTDLISVHEESTSSLPSSGSVSAQPFVSSASLLITPQYTRPFLYSIFLSVLQDGPSAAVDVLAASALALFFATPRRLNLSLLSSLQQILPIDAGAPVDDLVFMLARTIDTIFSNVLPSVDGLAINPVQESCHLTRLLSGIDYKNVYDFLNNPSEFAATMLRIFRYSPYNLLKVYFYKHFSAAQALPDTLAENKLLREAYVSTGTRFLFSILFPDDLIDSKSNSSQLNGQIRRGCSKILGADIAGPELLLFGLDDDGYPLQDWVRFTEKNSLTQEQRGIVFSVSQFLIMNCTENLLVKKGQREALTWVSYILPLMDESIAKRLVSDVLGKSPLDGEVQFLLSLQLAQFCDSGSISVHFYQRFTYLLQNHETKRAELESFIEKTLSLYLSQLTGSNSEVVKELFKALSTVQDERSYFDYALKTLVTLRETLYVDAADTLVLHLMQLGDTSRTLQLIKLLSRQLNSDLITQDAILSAGIADQSHSLNMRITMLRQGTTIGVLKCFMCQQPVYKEPVYPKSVVTSIEAGKNVQLERQISPSEAKTTHVFSCGHVFHHACLNETEEGLQRRNDVLNKYLLGEITTCEYQAHYKIECPVCK
ncbi:Hypothetical protein GLP15_234 [Giardia lamblia P15]|uniref:Uncharacterized protein n=1 Tax=Giardia intestinalis (strain P15) TaxID=658858 RepID=E1F1K5_GIAIA|nr:Hypothetical protein GLP15_234 [Giardia lamblia P15]